MDGGIQTKGGGTPDHRQARDVQTAVDHTYKRVGKIAANFTTLRMFARVKQNQWDSDRQNQVDAAEILGT